MWWRTSNCSPLLIYRPREDERLSWPGWLTYSRRLNHISGHPSATGRAQDGERTLARDWRSTAEPRGPTITVINYLYTVIIATLITCYKYLISMNGARCICHTINIWLHTWMAILVVEMLILLLLVGKWNSNVKVGTRCKSTTSERSQVSSWNNADVRAQTWHTARRSDSSLVRIVSVNSFYFTQSCITQLFKVTSICFLIMDILSGI